METYSFEIVESGTMSIKASSLEVAEMILDNYMGITGEKLIEDEEELLQDET